MMVGRILETDGCIAEGAAYLAAIEPRFAVALAQTGPLPLRRQAGGFTALLDAIVGQQVSVAAGDAIWRRMQAAGLTTIHGIMAASVEDMRAVGLSRQKASYAQALASAGIDFDALETAPTEGVIQTLTAVKGIGVWTAEIYAMFALGRADAFAAGDLALQESARVLFELDGRPNERALRKLAENWAPWRGVAARLLWSYYHIIKSREGIR
jgi:DNA-3-methyladenine glycosylase II